MNLVPVSNAVAAIVFLINRHENIGGEIFNVSDDDSPANNFADVERFLMNILGVPNYLLPRVHLPLGLLSFLLACMGRNNTNPRCIYSSQKLLDLGFVRPVAFEAGLAEYAAWYRSACLASQKMANP